MSMWIRRPARVAMLLLTAGVMAAAGACAPTGQHAGRGDPTWTHRSEEESREVRPATLIEFSDQASERMVGQLHALPEIAEKEGLVTVIIGDLNNTTRNVSTNEFEMMQRRLRGNLINASATRERLAFVEHRSRMQQLASRERVADAEGYTADAPSYDPDRTYTLNGNFYRVRRGDTDYYYMDFQLDSFATNRTVWQDSYEVKQLQR